MSSLQGDLVHDLAARLANNASLRLPGSLQRPGEEPLGQHQREEYLSSLLQRDAGVFLERHGHLLQAEDLQLFEPLRNDYEVDFYFRSLAGKPEAEKPRLSAKVRNRRLAQLNRLVDEGDYFSDEAMRSRAPLLHHQYVGQYRPAAPLEAAASGSAHPLSENLLTHLDEVARAALLQHEIEADAMVEAEGSDEEEYPEDRRAEVPQVAASPSESPAAASQQPAVPGKHPADGPATAGPSEPHAAAQPSPGEEGQKDDHDNAGQPRSTPGHGGAQPAEQAAAEEAQYVHIPEEERQQLASDFLELMHQRFLTGDDADFVSYPGIDADEALDDDWAAVARQDAEDKYFEDV